MRLSLRLQNVESYEGLFAPYALFKQIFVQDLPGHAHEFTWEVLLNKARIPRAGNPQGPAPRDFRCYTCAL